jgi:D-alanine-D-alanine ligase
VRLGLTFNLKPEGVADERFEEFDSEETITALQSALRKGGHDVIRLGWGVPMFEILQKERVEGVFNFAEGIGGRGRESQVPALLEMLGIPCSGSDALTIGLTLDKALAKLVAKAHGIATAPWYVAHSAQWTVDSGHPTVHRALSVHYPLFAKPAAEGSSMGITARSLCRDEDELRTTVDALREFGPVLVEEFLPGEEFTVGLIDGVAIGVMQVVPREKGADFIYSLDVKRDYQRLVEYRLVDRADVAKVAEDVWRAFGLRDVARVDVRCDRAGVPNFVEVNPLPGLHPVNSDLVILARHLGWSYDALVGRIIGSAERRW